MGDTATDIDPAWLAPTWFIDSDEPSVQQFADQATDGASTERDRAVALFLAVRDGYRYDPYNTDHAPEAFRASSVVASESNWCVPKSVLLTAAARHCEIPARLGFSDVRNHLSSEKLMESMGTDLFVWHGYSELLIDGEWRKASSAFNIELCDRFGVKVLDFDGTNDALMHAFDESGNRHMEYVNQRGSFDDLPLDEILATFGEVYGSSDFGSGSDDSAFAP